MIADRSQVLVLYEITGTFIENTDHNQLIFAVYYR